MKQHEPTSLAPILLKSDLTDSTSSDPSTPVEGEDGEVKHVMPPESEWPVREMESIDDASIQNLKESIPLPVIFTVRPTEEGGHYPGEANQHEILRRPLHRASTRWILNCPLRTAFAPTPRQSQRRRRPRDLFIHDTTTTPALKNSWAWSTSTPRGRGVQVLWNGQRPPRCTANRRGQLRTQELKARLFHDGAGNGGDWARLTLPFWANRLSTPPFARSSNSPTRAWSTFETSRTPGP